KPGLVYRGTVTAKQRGTVETLILRFAEQSPDGMTLRATLESATNAGWVRPFRGTIIDNTYRAGRHPIRLGTLDRDRVTQADAKSPLGLYIGADNFTIRLRAEATRLVGEDERYAYQFELGEATSSTGDRSQVTELKP